ncbi:hypothetical protein PPERSA_03083 [Pseudocohnilembus persalinus]|uniref:Uncharacterized protein n=1 Tax=Pseudocohnilembus persalinus TaxID=266149 RepID=A0A0V0QLX5_PSEPJ|nr:hypothetical protein PPERSA_03083 [Pseudocohnilembus persalinus]|eukprot:KRX02992.1 hypothetical protein PPERSA_03083 [Pseudocohnilembus persalinus]
MRIMETEQQNCIVISEDSDTQQDQQINEDNIYLSQKKTVSKLPVGTVKLPVLEKVSLYKLNNSKKHQFNCYRDEDLNIPPEFCDKTINHSTDDDVETDEEIYKYSTRFIFRELRKALTVENEDFDPQEYALKIEKIRPELRKKTPTKQEQQ